MCYKHNITARVIIIFLSSNILQQCCLSFFSQANISSNKFVTLFHIYLLYIILCPAIDLIFQIPLLPSLLVFTSQITRALFLLAFADILTSQKCKLCPLWMTGNLSEKFSLNVVLPTLKRGWNSSTTKHSITGAGALGH